MKIQQVPSPTQIPRIQGATIQFLVMHYTAVSLKETLAIFQDPKSELSAHYTILDKPQDNCWIYQHVPESLRAYHAGKNSYWRGITSVNSHSIGIEHVCLGHRWRDDYPTDGSVKVPGWHELFYPYSEGQIEAAIPLYKRIIAEYNIQPWNIVGHDMVALPYGRKIDPGPLFPWQWLAREHNIGLWPDFSQTKGICTPDEAQKLLTKIGFLVNSPESLQGALRAFQMHWRPTNVAGILDAETQSRLIAVAQCVP